MDPEADVATLVAGFTSRTLGTNLFRGPMLAASPQVPADCVFVQAHRGDRPQPLLGTGMTVWSADVEVSVRGPPSDREAARTTARELLQQVQQSTRTGLPGYSLALVVDGEPEQMPQEANLSHVYVFSLTVQWVS